MNSSFGGMRTTIRATVIALTVAATLLTIALATGVQYYFGHSLARDAAANLYATASSGIAAELQGISRANRNIIDVLDDNPLLREPGSRAVHLKVFADVLDKNPLYYGIYFGDSSGQFFEVVNLGSSARARDVLQAHASDQWLIVSVERDKERGTRKFEYLDKDFNTRHSHQETTDFDVSSRPWYTAAMASNDVQYSAPYLFAQLEEPGRTISKRVPGSNTVVAIDMTLTSISDFLAQHKVAGHGEVYLYNTHGRIIASSLDRSADLAAPSSQTSGPGHQGFASDDPGQQDLLHKQALATNAADMKLSSSMVPHPALLDIAADPQQHNQLLEIQHEGAPYLAYIAPVTSGANPMFVGILSSSASVVAPLLEKVTLSLWITGGILLLVLPLSWILANPIIRPIRQLAAENQKVQQREYSSVRHVETRVRELDELSDSMLSMVASIQAHELAQRELMDAFIELIAQAIDDKSSHTGGHCARVPELALMLAEQASASQLPAFRDFSLESDDEWREYRIAAWLHDCGKITTPEHIVDKGSKLETIYNRIHEVRMRFEVLWRDAELNYWQQRSDAPDKEEQLAGLLKSKQQELQDDFSFIASCNVGGEFLHEDDLERLQDIAQKTWQRHFDDRLGLSPAEELRFPVRHDPLPSTEQLLRDLPEHLIEREESTNHPPGLGIKMDTPLHLYNLGEVYNLSIARGTLTEEDRFKINEHMISTIKMLESLPFPDELKNVPRYASTHHETMRGSGYPRKLDGKALSVPERILAIADIFEALTAADRPYKKAKPVSVALEIMRDMVREQHIDEDCFELFVREKVYERYARQFLPPEQLDHG